MVRNLISSLVFSTYSCSLFLSSYSSHYYLFDEGTGDFDLSQSNYVLGKKKFEHFQEAQFSRFSKASFYVRNNYRRLNMLNKCLECRSYWWLLDNLAECSTWLQILSGLQLFFFQHGIMLPLYLSDSLIQCLRIHLFVYINIFRVITLNSFISLLGSIIGLPLVMWIAYVCHNTSLRISTTYIFSHGISGPCES